MIKKKINKKKNLNSIQFIFTLYFQISQTSIEIKVKYLLENVNKLPVSNLYTCIQPYKTLVT